MGTDVNVPQCNSTPLIVSAIKQNKADFLYLVKKSHIYFRLYVVTMSILPSSY